MAPILTLPAFLDEPPGLSAPFRALVADDDGGVRDLLARFLTIEGVTVETAETGREALTRVREERPDIVLLDVAMPGRTGLDVLTHIRELGLQTAVIITTAYGTEDVVTEALRRGADDYLRKPFDRGDVLAVLDRTTARLLLRRQNDALRARIEEHQRYLETELARAAGVVAELLPMRAPRLEGFGLSAACRSAREVGGDFYDWRALPGGRLALTVGDVMGKGLPAALLMATVRAVLRALVPDHTAAEVVQQTARALDDDLTRSGAFVTLFHAQIDPSTGHVRYVDAGHGYVLLRRADGTVEELRPWGLPIGVDLAERYCEGSIELKAGDTLIVYSDGLAEARPDIFGDRETLAAYAARSTDADEIVRMLMAEVAQVRPLPDDLTVVVLCRQPVVAGV